MTGAQEALPDTGPQPVADARGGHPRPGHAAHPDQWYDPPRLDDRDLDTAPRRPASDGPRLDAPRPDEVRPSRPVDPRLEGMTYGELRYDDPDCSDGAARRRVVVRGAAAQRPGVPAGSRRGRRASGGPQGPGSGPQRRTEPRSPGSRPAARPPAGAGPGGRLRSGPLGRLGPEHRGAGRR